MLSFFYEWLFFVILICLHSFWCFLDKYLFLKAIWITFKLKYSLWTLYLSQFPSFFWQKANYFGSLLQTSTVSLGSGLESEVNVPFRDLLPMVHPNDIVFDGMSCSWWIIQSLYFKTQTWKCLHLDPEEYNFREGLEFLTQRSKLKIRMCLFLVFQKNLIFYWIREEFQQTNTFFSPWACSVV